MPSPVEVYELQQCLKCHNLSPPIDLRFTSLAHKNKPPYTKQGGYWNWSELLIGYSILAFPIRMRPDLLITYPSNNRADE
jgi:hypothetical protein